MANFGASEALVQVVSKTQAARWASLAPSFALKLRRVFNVLVAQGHRPILGSAWRDLVQQAKLLAGGQSTVSFSYHNAVDDHGNPAAQAADVVDERYLWGARLKTDTDVQAAARTAGAENFFQALGQAAESEGLTWGGRWTTFRDPAHVQVKGTTRAVLQAQYEKVKGAIESGHLLAVPMIAGRGYFEVLKSLPLWYWVALFAGGALLVGVLAKRQARRRRYVSVQSTVQ